MRFANVLKATGGYDLRALPNLPAVRRLFEARLYPALSVDELAACQGPRAVAEKLRQVIALDGGRAPTPDERAALEALDRTVGSAG